MKPPVKLQQHVQDASATRIVELLARVGSWVVNINDPQDSINRDTALRLANQILRTNELDTIEIGRKFLFGLCQDVRAQDFDMEDV